MNITSEVLSFNERYYGTIANDSLMIMQVICKRVF